MFVGSLTEVIKMAEADGKCRSCGGSVPEDNDNLFYCSESCRIIGWRNNHPGEPEPDWESTPRIIFFT